MTHVRLDVAPHAAHVRVARLVAVSLARLGGVDEDEVEDVRLAVGEACGRAVAAHLRHGVDAPVRLTFTGSHGLVASVVDRVGLPPARGHEAIDLLLAGADAESGDAATLLVLLAGLAERFEVRTGPAGTTIDLGWPTAG